MPNYLIIDDDSVMHVIYKRRFKTDTQLEGYKANSCFGYQEAVVYVNGLAPDEIPDFIMLDLQLEAGHTGWEFLKSDAYKKLPTNVSVFICTSSISSADKAKSMNFPSVKGYFVKPIDIKIIDYIKSQILHAN